VPRATAYEVVWRPTAVPDWVAVEKAGNATTITLPRSKDNVVFGVRAVDAQGHRSIAVMPKPDRSPTPAAASTER
jgi:hypothetical protein